MSDLALTNLVFIILAFIVGVIAGRLHYRVVSDDVLLARIEYLQYENARLQSELDNSSKPVVTQRSEWPGEG